MGDIKEEPSPRDFPVFVVTSLKFATTRWPAISTLLKNAGLANMANYVYFKSEDDAVRHRVQDCVSTNFSNAAPEVGLKRKHAAFNAIEHLAAAAATLHLNVSYALILEDDATGGGAALKCLWSSVNAMATARNDTGFVQLTTWDGTLRLMVAQSMGGQWEKFSSPVLCSDKSQMHIETVRSPPLYTAGSNYASAYILTARAARVFLTNFSFFDRAIDHHMNFMHSQGGPNVDFVSPGWFGQSVHQKAH